MNNLRLCLWEGDGGTARGRELELVLMWLSSYNLWSIMCLLVVFMEEVSKLHSFTCLELATKMCNFLLRGDVWVAFQSFPACLHMEQLDITVCNLKTMGEM